MPQLSFQKQFVEAVENGLDLLAGRPLKHPGVRPKIQTIRAMRKRPFRVGDTLYVCTGARTKQYRKLGEANCDQAATVWMEKTGFIAFFDMIDRRGKRKTMPLRRVHEIAKADGFKDAAAMFDFFETTHGLPFYGQLIRMGHLDG